LPAHLEPDILSHCEFNRKLPATWQRCATE